MQRVFHEQTLRHVPAFGEILLNVVSLAKVFEGRNYFAKFMCPPTVGQAVGDWKTFYKRWSMFTTEQMDVGLLDLVAPLIDVSGAEA